MFLLNPRAARRAYDADLQSILNLAEGRASRERLSSWDRLSPHPTPAWSLPGLAASLGIAGLTLKDESQRSSLGSFKALGAPNALIRLVMRRRPDGVAAGWRAQDLLRGMHAHELADFVVISATDGNHGRALAAAAQSIGCRCIIVLHAHVSQEREDAIAAFGAQIVRIAGNYDASVEEAARLAQANGWEVVSDTSYEGYEEVPRDVMQGYGILAEELLETANADACPWTHVVLQGGVGGLAAGIVSHFWERYGDRRPRFIVVEPEQADCLCQSALQGRPARAKGSVDSVMAGLACGETSPLAWRFLEPAVDVFLTVPDAQAVDAMRVLANGAQGDVPVVAGESGAAGLAALQVIARDATWKREAGLTAESRVLLINTEGATAPKVYEALAVRSHEEVLAARQAWLQQRSVGQAALLERIEAHAAIGAIEGGGVCRLALIDADRDGRDQLVAWMRELDLAVSIDRIGNIFGTRRGRTDSAPVMTGSHIATPFVGRLIDRRGIKRVTLACISLFALATAAMALSPASALVFLAMFAVVGVFSAGQAPLPYAQSIATAFDRRRGLALGIAMTGVGLGAALIPALAQFYLQKLGWRGAFVAVGVTVFVVAFPAVALFLRDAGARGRPGTASVAELPGLAAREVVRSREFWLLGLVFICIPVVANGVIFHLVALLTDHGIAAERAVGVFAAIGPSLIGGRLLCGYFLDRVHGPYVAVAFIVLAAIGVLVLLNGGDPSLVTLGAVLVGLGLGAEVDLIGYLQSRYFGLRAFGQVYGYLFAIFTVGAALGPFVMGASFDAFGSYRPMLAAFLGVLAVAGIAMLCLPRRYPFAIVHRAARGGQEAEAIAAPAAVH